MLGSVMDADDAVQDTMLRAWKSLAGFDGRSSLRSWLYRIATNVCLDALAVSARRARPLEEGRVGTLADTLETLPREHWLEPVPDARALPSDVDPAEQAVLRESIRLAFVAALQHLPPKQRAALLLAEVLGWSAAEVAASLDTSVAAVNSALQRARATLAARATDAGNLDPRTPTPPLAAALLERYVAAFERYDVDGLVALLQQDVVMSMPPYTLWLRGHEAVRGWLLGRGAGCRGSRFLPTQACGLPAFAQYRPAPEGGYRPWSLVVLEGSGELVQRMTFFLDTETLFARFGMPERLQA
jgi:RNA polymerase sigma-70 factor, ECF subfamily